MSAVRHFRWCKMPALSSPWSAAIFQGSGLRKGHRASQRIEKETRKTTASAWKSEKSLEGGEKGGSRESEAAEAEVALSVKGIISPLLNRYTVCYISLMINAIHRLQVNLSSMGCLSLCFLPFPRMPCIDNHREHAWTCHIPSSSPSSNDA